MSHSFAFAGREFRALPDRALFWPARQALLVADLHFEKASWFAARGQYLPPYDSAATLTRLEALVTATRPREIWCLGDNFHDADGPDRLGLAARARLAALADGRRLQWITGNHDAAAAIPGDSRPEAEADGIILRHEADPAEHRPEISGHFHPVARVRTGGRTIRRPCVLATGRRLILPAFGALTGGLDVTDVAFAPLICPDTVALVPTARQLLRLPVPAS